LSYYGKIKATPFNHEAYMWERFFGFLKPRIKFEGWEDDVQTLPPPDSVRLPLSRSEQMPFNPVVEVGDKVKTGQFIAMLPSRTGVHATVTGRVTSIGPGSSWDGREILTLSIQRESEDVPETPIMPEALEKISQDQLIQTMADLGFASPWKPESLKDKLSEVERTPVHTIIIGAVDREPPISVQRRFLTEFSGNLAESVEGLRIIAGDARIVVAVPESMEGQARSILKDVEIFPVGDLTLDTNPTLLIYKITGKFYTAHKNPRRDGIAVISAENLAFVARCLHKGKSRTNKLVTVSAPDLDKPVTVRVRLGTPVGHVLKSLNIKVNNGDRVVFGGPLMGVAQPDLNANIVMGVSGVTVIPLSEVVPFTDAPCINCGRCVSVCPVNIQVNLVGRYSEFGYFEKAVMEGSGSCVECGLCAYVCPSRRPLLQYMKFANYQYGSLLKEKETREEGD
jgi:electron transport complex protein RnfC